MLKLHQVATLVREMGYAADDFHPENCIYVGGGLKRAQLPADYQQFVHETFNIPADQRFQNYSMQELNSGMPRCRTGGRYFSAPDADQLEAVYSGLATRFATVNEKQEMTASFAGFGLVLLLGGLSISLLRGGRLP